MTKAGWHDFCPPRGVRDKNSALQPAQGSEFCGHLVHRKERGGVEPEGAAAAGTPSASSNLNKHTPSSSASTISRARQPAFSLFATSSAATATIRWDSWV
eukprot:CAMPEP_0177637556 /NCGR_PEP_ID=MMETSP0447-20121125/5032_1 /TAXON_ID=0 /ORGANISM="Stygamoeba regulata, Strain BSH-02190019" /LENGTH=99 /DNA_ID=CAMNT_0019139487 /DNA_START=375 /DNA_END=673 /DNA_ORIENTATION=-